MGNVARRIGTDRVCCRLPAGYACATRIGVHVHLSSRRVAQSILEMSRNTAFHGGNRAVVCVKGGGGRYKVRSPRNVKVVETYAGKLAFPLKKKKKESGKKVDRERD